MKKAFKFLLYFLGGFIILLLVVLGFHDAIIKFALQKAIFSQSNGKATLVIEDFRFDLINGSIVIDHPVLDLQEVYMNETRSIKLNRTSYNKIEIDGLNLKELILRRNIIASRFLIDKPEFWFTEQDTDIKSSFHPEKIIDALNQNPEAFSRINIQISDIEIHYGSIKLSEYTSEEVDPGLVDFTFILKNFNTQPDSSVKQDRILFSDEFLFKLKNLHRELKSGYILGIDSAVFNSTHKNLVLGGISFVPKEINSEKNAIGLIAGKLTINNIGLEEVRGLEDLSLRSIKLSDGYFSNYILDGYVAKVDTGSKPGLEQLSQVLYDFRLDTVSISNFQYFNIRNTTDTVISTNDINFLLTGIEIDSGMFNDPLTNVEFESVKLSTGGLKIEKIIPELKLTYENLSYSSIDSNLVISKLKVNGDTLSGNSESVEFYLDILDVQGFSLHRFQKQQTQHLNISIIDPIGKIDLDHQLFQKKSSNGKPLVPHHLVLDQVKLQNGAFEIVKGKALNIDLTGFDFELDGLRFPANEDEQFRYRRLIFGYDKIISAFEDGKNQVVTGQLNYSEKRLSLKDVNIKHLSGSPTKLVQVKIKEIGLHDLNLDKLLFENELELGRFTVKYPKITGNFQLPTRVTGNENDAEQEGPVSPLSFSVGGFQLLKGTIDATIFKDIEEIKISTDYDFVLEGINAENGEPLKSILDDLMWKAHVTNLDIDISDHQIHLKSFLSDAFESQLSLEGLTVNSTYDDQNKHNKLEVKNLYLPLFDVSGIDYKLFVEQDSISISTLRINDPVIELMLPIGEGEKKPSTNKKLDIRKYLFFDYDTIVLNRLQLNIEKPGDSSHIVIDLDEFNFNHRYTSSTEGNLLTNLGFAFDQFSFSDTIADKYLIIRRGFISSTENSFTIQGIKGGNIADYDDGSIHPLKSSTEFESSEIVFSGIYLREALPSRLKVSKLDIGDFDLELTRIEKKEKQKQKSNLTFNLEVLRRFSNVMTKLSVDTTILGDINFHYKTLGDTSEHTIQFDSIALIVNKIDVDTSMIGQSKPNLISSLTVDLKGRTRITRDSLYEIQTGRLHYDFPNHQISIDSFYVTPRFVDSIFFKKAKYQTDRVKLFGRRIEVSDIDVDALLNENHIHIGSIALKEFDVDMYRDKRFPLRPGIYKMMPREALMGMEQKFTIDSLLFTDSHFKYSEFADKSEYPGEVYFTDFNVSGYNLTNNIDDDDHESMIKINLNAKIMGATKMELSLFFPLYPDSTAFWLTAKSEEIDMVQLNSMTENLLGIGITHGKGSVDIPLITANDSIAYGSMIFRYKRLKLALYSRKKDQLNKGLWSIVANALINDLVVRSNNPRFARKPKTGLVYFKRDTRKGIVNYAWKGMLSGMLSTLGFNNKGQRKERKELKKAP